MRLPELPADGTTCLAIAAALAAGIAASYGRELEANRRPDRHWWVRRLLLTPLLVICATAATDLFSLSKSAAAFTAAMLSIGGYDVLKLVEARWRRGVGLIDGGPHSPPVEPGSRPPLQTRPGHVPRRGLWRSRPPNGHC